MKRVWKVEKRDNWEEHFGDSQEFDNMMKMLDGPYHKKDGEILDEAPYDYKITIIREKVKK